MKREERERAGTGVQPFLLFAHLDLVLPFVLDILPFAAVVTDRLFLLLLLLLLLDACTLPRLALLAQLVLRHA